MSAGANPWRGEVALVLGDVRHVLRPSFAALVAAEQELGSLIALIDRVGSGDLRIGEVVALFWHCLEDQERHAREAFAEAVARAGLSHCTAALKTLLTQVLKGDG